MILGPPDAQLVLQAAVTKTASFDSAGLDLRSGFAPQEPGEPMVGVVNVTAIDTTSGNETYSFVLQHSDDDNTYVACGAAVVATAVSQVLAKGFVTKRYVRLSLTAGGTTPSITYSAQLSPLRLA
jgi:hypothetical protein